MFSSIFLCFCFFVSLRRFLFLCSFTDPDALPIPFSFDNASIQIHGFLTVWVWDDLVD
jgi:hypothetical protein